MKMDFISLADTTSFVVDNRGKTVPTVDSGIPLIKTNCITNTQLHPHIDGSFHVSQETYDSWFRAHPVAGDLILTLKGSQNGAVCLVPNPVNFVIAQDMVALRINEEVINSHYLLAALRSREVQHQIKTLDVSGVIPHLKKTDFDKLILPYPSREIQDFIGELYYKLSSKIELLRQQNQTLEELAQTLFKRWFVEFEFPNEKGEPYKSSGGLMVESELGEIPEGWRVGILSNIADITIGRTPPRKESQWFTTDKNDIKWVSIKDMGDSGMFISNTSECLTKKAVEKFRVPVIPKNTTILSFKLTVGRVAITTENMISNEAIAHIRLKEDYDSFRFSYLLLKRYNYDRLGSTSSIATAVNSNSIKNMEILIPSPDIITQFDSCSSSIFNKIRLNTEEIQTLTQLRDTLLPKLMSGELRVNTSGNE